MSLHRPLFCFTFQNRRGAVFPGDFVCWGTASMQIEACRPALRAAIEAARPA